jgi:hypothetical protein
LDRLTGFHLDRISYKYMIYIISFNFLIGDHKAQFLRDVSVFKFSFGWRSFLPK